MAPFPTNISQIFSLGQQYSPSCRQEADPCTQGFVSRSAQWTAANPGPCKGLASLWAQVAPWPSGIQLKPTLGILGEAEGKMAFLGSLSSQLRKNVFHRFSL